MPFLVWHAPKVGFSGDGRGRDERVAIERFWVYQA